MKKIKKIVAGVFLSTMLVGAIPVFAISGSNKSINTGLVKYYSLNHYEKPISARAETQFVPLSGNSHLRSYVYIEAINSKGVRLSSKQNYGPAGGTSSKPSYVSLVHSQSGTSRWGSTHRSEKTSQYAALRLSN